MNRQVIRNVIAKCSDGAVIVRTAPFTEQIRETVNQYLRTGLRRIIEKQFLSGFFALAVIPLGIASINVA